MRTTNKGTPTILVGVAGIATVSAVLSLAALGLLHWLEPEVNPGWQFVSEYALGPFGWIMNATFFGMALGLFAVGTLSLFRLPSVTGRIGAALAFVSGVGMVLAGGFNTDPSPSGPASWAGEVHNLGALLNLTPYAALFVTLALAKRGGLSAVRVPALLAAITVITDFAFVGSAASQGEFGPGSATALIGRIELALYLLWQMTAASAFAIQEKAAKPSPP